MPKRRSEPPKDPVILIDTDIMIWKSTWRNTVEAGAFDNDEAVFWYEKAAEDLVADIKSLEELCSASKVVCCIGGGGNYRFNIYPEYKANRGEKPDSIKQMYDTLEDFLPYEIRKYPDLEADDALGLLHTGEFKDESIIITTDKDLRTVPGWHMRPYEEYYEPEYVSTTEATRFHMIQTLMGDSTDNIKGCPRIGKVKAARVIDKNPTWSAVLETYQKAGLGMDELLLNGRLTFILQDGWYDFETSEVKLWSP